MIYIQGSSQGKSIKIPHEVHLLQDQHDNKIAICYIYHLKKKHLKVKKQDKESCLKKHGKLKKVQRLRRAKQQRIYEVT